MPAPSVKARKLSQLTKQPWPLVHFLLASVAPVKAALVMEFLGSSFPLTWTILQSIMENRPPQPAKLPPNCGGLVLVAVTLPCSLWFTPTGEWQKLLIAWKTPLTVVLIIKAHHSLPQFARVRLLVHNFSILTWGDWASLVELDPTGPQSVLHDRLYSISQTNSFNRKKFLKSYDPPLWV